MVDKKNKKSKDRADDSLWKRIGTIGRPRGLQGAFWVGGRSRPLPPVYRDLLVGERPDASAVSCCLIRLEEHGGRSIVTLDQFSDRTALEGVAGQTIWAPVSIFEDRLESLLGLACIDVAGLPMGTVSGFANYGASDILEISESSSGQCLGIPFTEEYFDTSISAPADGVLRLRVARELFEGLWS